MRLPVRTATQDARRHPPGAYQDPLGSCCNLRHLPEANRLVVADGRGHAGARRLRTCHDAAFRGCQPGTWPRGHWRKLGTGSLCLVSHAK
jgi:hypothetical protein